MKIQTLINLADQLDDSGLVKEAAIIDDFLKTAAKNNLHPSGLKKESVEFHQKLFDGYKTIMKSSEKDSPNMGALRENLANQSHNHNGVALHEMYFEDIINSQPCSLSECKEAQELLKDLYDGGPKQLIKEMSRVMLTPRNGWVILNFCTLEKMLYLDICDLHDIHPSISSVPVLVLDMWEHAYINDFGIDKEAYFNWFLSRIDWRNFVKRTENLLNLK
jgi:Fe-Mn family superoxide dismutase